MSMFERTELLLGSEALNKLNKANVIVFGIGGVGGYVCEMLARTGLGNITIVDGDKVESSNINRQIIAMHSTIGKYKVDVMKERLININPNIKVNALQMRYNENTQNEFVLNSYDYIIDAIDSVSDKILLIKNAKEANANIISSMGAGNRSGVPNFEICDIFKTSYDSLAKKIRQNLKDVGVNNLMVCYTKEPAIKRTPVASVAYYPSVCGITIASFVINKLI